jgi:hypothetical protein
MLAGEQLNEMKRQTELLASISTALSRPRAA